MLNISSWLIMFFFSLRSSVSQVNTLLLTLSSFSFLICLIWSCKLTSILKELKWFGHLDASWVPPSPQEETLGQTQNSLEGLYSISFLAWGCLGIPQNECLPLFLLQQNKTFFYPIFSKGYIHSLKRSYNKSFVEVYQSFFLDADKYWVVQYLKTIPMGSLLNTKLFSLASKLWSSC